MAAAVCTVCGGVSRWRSHRGARLTYLRSPCCDAQMRGPRRGETEGLLPCIVCRVAYPSGSERIWRLDGFWAACRRHPADLVEEKLRTWAGDAAVAARLLRAYHQALAREEGVPT